MGKEIYIPRKVKNGIENTPENLAALKGERYFDTTVGHIVSQIVESAYKGEYDITISEMGGRKNFTFSLFDIADIKKIHKDVLNLLRNEYHPGEDYHKFENMTTNGFMDYGSKVCFEYQIHSICNDKINIESICEGYIEKLNNLFEKFMSGFSGKEKEELIGYDNLSGELDKRGKHLFQSEEEKQGFLDDIKYMYEHVYGIEKNEIKTIKYTYLDIKLREIRVELGSQASKIIDSLIGLVNSRGYNNEGIKKYM